MNSSRHLALFQAVKLLLRYHGKEGVRIPQKGFLVAKSGSSHSGRNRRMRFGRMPRLEFLEADIQRFAKC